MSCLAVWQICVTHLDIPSDSDFCDHETCRRYLIANNWNPKKALGQLSATLEWRIAENPGKLEFWQSPKALENPNSLSMRVIGMDKEGRPICYTCFAEALDRWDNDANMVHMTALMESCAKLLKQRRAAGLNRTAASRQWVWVIDFFGFGWKDQSPNAAIITAKLMAHYPEMLHMAVLVNSPMLFRGVWSILQPMLETRTKEKVVFLKGEKAKETLERRLGQECTEWLMNEGEDNKAKHPMKKKGDPKKYWVAPSDPKAHDPRGPKSYLESPYYIKTPGDAFLERQQQQLM